jgi:exodeoxyribonuclease V alpha subunit
MTLFAPPAGEPQKFEGTVERITFANADNGWSVVRFHPSDGRGDFTAVGHLPGISVGETMRLCGRFVSDPKWGEQLRVEQAEILPPASTAGLERWLGSGAIKGIGKGLARRLVERFGLELIDLLDRDPEQLLAVRRLSRKKLGGIKASWDEQRGVREAMIYLQSVDATPGMARRIWKRYGPATVSVIRDDPYRLALEVDGVGFVTSDRIARASGVPPDSPRRAAAGLLHVLRERSAEGHVWVDRETLFADAVKLLGEAAPPLDGPLATLIVDGHLAEGEGEEADEGLYALPRLERAERAAAEALAALLAARPPREGGDPTLALARFEAERAIVLDEVQRTAIRRAAESKVFVLTGGPGTGKTTIVSALLDLFEGQRARIRLASPTGRAARRLQEASSREAVTIHRLLEWNPALGTFARDESNRVDADLVVVGEY